MSPFRVFWVWSAFLKNTYQNPKHRSRGEYAAIVFFLDHRFFHISLLEILPDLIIFGFVEWCVVAVQIMLRAIPNGSTCAYCWVSLDKKKNNTDPKNIIDRVGKCAL